MYKIPTFRINRVNLIFIVIIIFGLIILALLVLFFEKDTFKVPFSRSTERTSDDALKDRKEPLFGVGGSVEKIENSKSGNRLVTLRSDFGSSYKVTISNSFAIYQVDRKLTKKEVQTTRSATTAGNIKVGSRIYVETNVDILHDQNIQPEEIRSIEIYK